MREGLTPGRIVWYQTDERNGLSYFLPAIVTVTTQTHPGDYPDGSKNPLPVPTDDDHVHLTVYTPGGFGTKVVTNDGREADPANAHGGDEVFKAAEQLLPGSGTYVELDVPYNEQGAPRSWRWPERA